LVDSKDSKKSGICCTQQVLSFVLQGSNENMNNENGLLKVKKPAQGRLKITPKKLSMKIVVCRMAKEIKSLIVWLRIMRF